MKKLLLLLFLIIASFSQAQTVNISDFRFKDALLNHNPVIDTNGDGEIQVSEAIAFTGNMDVSYKNIHDLTGIEAFTNITGLNCKNNHINSIDTSSNTNLTELDCSNNRITNLDVSNNSNLTILKCNSNSLLYDLDVSNNTNLTTLDCSHNYLGDLIVSGASNLITLDCSFNNISDLNVSDATNLTDLNCTFNRLNALNLSNNTNLETLSCDYNSLSTLDVSNKPNLTTLYCINNQLGTLDVSNNPNLTTLNCQGNQINSLDISQSINLETLNCEHNSLTTLDLSHNVSLTDLNCGINQLTNLDVSNLSNLNRLHCHKNQLTNLDLSGNTNLLNLDCFDNQINSIDISQNINLIDLWCEKNQLTSLDISQNINLSVLWCYNNQLSNLNVSNNANLTRLRIYNNQISTIDLSHNINLSDFRCDNNLIDNLDLSNNTNLEYLFCNNNQLTNLDMSNNIKLRELYCNENLLTDIDLSNNFRLELIQCSDNPNLSYINLKNGNNNHLRLYGSSTGSDFQNLPNLETVCVDDIDSHLTTYITSRTGHSVTFTEYCSLNPAQTNIINGNLLVDIDNNGCDSNDYPVNMVRITADNGTESFSSFTQDNGQYLLYTNDGNFTTTVGDINLPNYFSVNPNVQTNIFTGFNNTFTADFCVEPNQTVNDVNIDLFNTLGPVPGFNTTYQLVYRNIGTTQLNGNITLDFDGNKLNFVNASETPSAQGVNSLTFDYSNLNPFETKVIDLEFHLLTPPTVNIGDNLQFTTTINPVAGDVTPNDNTYTLNQTVVGSYDPNDITCLEGDEILPADTDKYLHYVIRFQNTGTAEAQNIVVTNELDDNLDWSTLQLESVSHNNRVAITNGKNVEFIFENINLPDSTTDEPNSHGYIAYKIKPKANIALGDVISNNADIYFDYNPAVATNTVTTTVVNSLGVDKNTLLDFSVYPTPTTNILNVSSKTKIKQISIYNQLGQKIMETQKTPIDVSNLSKGVYLVKVKDFNGNFGMSKIVKK